MIFILFAGVLINYIAPIKTLILRTPALLVLKNKN